VKISIPSLLLWGLILEHWNIKSMIFNKFYFFFLQISSINQLINSLIISYKLNIWDVGGQKSIRTYWRNYFEQTDAIIWVVDSVDKRRIRDCKMELDKLLMEEVKNFFSDFLISFHFFFFFFEKVNGNTKLNQFNLILFLLF